MNLFIWSFSSLPLIYSRRVVSVTSGSMCWNYWLTACSSLSKKKGELAVPPMIIPVYWDVKQHNKQTQNIFKNTNNRTFVFNAYEVYFTCLKLDR